MKIYKIKVNGKLYEVEVESVTESTAKIVAAPLPSPAVVPTNTDATICSPMQGTILQVNATVGSPVRKGSVLFILEAMKLENEILAPADGIVKQLLVNKGQAVNANQVLLIVG